MFLPPFTSGLLAIHILCIYIYIFGYFKHKFPWICGLTGFSRPPFFLEETHISYLNMAGELFHGFKNKKGKIFCILHCISHTYISLCSRASFIWTTRLKHLFCCFHGLPIGISRDSMSASDTSKVVPYGSKRRSSCSAPKFRWFCLANLEEIKTNGCFQK